MLHRNTDRPQSTTQPAEETENNTVFDTLKALLDPRVIREDVIKTLLNADAAVG
jgi:hypothetical protein